MKRGLVFVVGLGYFINNVYAASFDFGVRKSPVRQNFTLILLLILLVIITFYIIYKITKKGGKPIKRKNSR